jgi:hypothetical protein
MIDNGLTSYFADWSVKDVDIGNYLDRPTSNVYNNIIKTGGGGTLSANETITINTALIIENIPITAINNIQAIVFYNRLFTTNARAIGLAIELYNSINDPDLTEVLATTNVITSASNIYRFDFSSISTYTDFVEESSITNIVSNSFALTQDAIFTVYAIQITGDVVISGFITASNKYFCESDEVVKAFGLYGSTLHYYQVEDDLNTFINSGVNEGDTIIFLLGVWLVIFLWKM